MHPAPDARVKVDETSDQKEGAQVEEARRGHFLFARATGPQAKQPEPEEAASDYTGCDGSDEDRDPSRAAFRLRGLPVAC